VESRQSTKASVFGSLVFAAEGAGVDPPEDFNQPWAASSRICGGRLLTSGAGGREAGRSADLRVGAFLILAIA